MYVIVCDVIYELVEKEGQSLLVEFDKTGTASGVLVSREPRVDGCRVTSNNLELSRHLAWATPLC
jgi:hypothetical protein